MLEEFIVFLRIMVILIFKIICYFVFFKFDIIKNEFFYVWFSVILVF